jgi:predicted permease
MANLTKLRNGRISILTADFLPKETIMNLKLKAALQITAFVAGAIAFNVGATLGLQYLSSIYGSDAVANGVVQTLMGGALLFCIWTLWKIRVGQLESQQELDKRLR